MHFKAQNPAHFELLPFETRMNGCYYQLLGLSWLHPWDELQPGVFAPDPVGFVSLLKITNVFIKHYKLE